MARQRRDKSAGRFHIYTHCVWAARAHFRDDVDRMEFLRGLARTFAKFEWRCIGFCLMRTHYHLVVDVEEGVLPAAMQSLNHGYACHFNRRHNLRGHAQADRYGSTRLHDTKALLDAYAYAMNNPVEAAACSKASDWTWSSFRGTLGLAEANSFVDDALVLSCYGRELDPVAALRRAVEGL